MIKSGELKLLTNTRLCYLGIYSWRSVLVVISDKHLMEFYENGDTPEVDKPFLSISTLNSQLLEGHRKVQCSDCCISNNEDKVFTVVENFNEKETVLMAPSKEAKDEWVEFFEFLDFQVTIPMDCSSIIMLNEQSSGSPSLSSDYSRLNVSKASQESLKQPAQKEGPPNFDSHVLNESDPLKSNSPKCVNKTSNTVSQISSSGPMESEWESKIERRLDLAEDMEEFDYDEMFRGLEPMRSNKDTNRSVVGSLVSELLRTMNPSRVRLPTCVLECRSLLESYSDSFACPEYFTTIAKGSDPYERFLSVLRWYLSTLKTTRPLDQPTKPYNPTLGEFFFCTWPVEEESVGVKFIAEQISHHPPITACYAEHAQSGITFTSKIFTRSGMTKTWRPPFLDSLKVDHVGEARVRLVAAGEEYVMTYPSAIVKSVLRHPSLLVEGRERMQCKQTKITAEIQFRGKFKVWGKIMCGSTETATFSGEWNAVVEMFHNKQRSTGIRKEVFLDMSSFTIPQHAKQVAAIKLQRTQESRRLWRNVTRALIGRHSTLRPEDAKYEVEQAAKKRKEQRDKESRVWHSRFFATDPDQQTTVFKYELGREKSTVKTPISDSN